MKKILILSFVVAAMALTIVPCTQAGFQLDSNDDVKISSNLLAYNGKLYGDANLISKFKVDPKIPGNTIKIHSKKSVIVDRVEIASINGDIQFSADADIDVIGSLYSNSGDVVLKANRNVVFDGYAEAQRDLIVHGNNDVIKNTRVPVSFTPMVINGTPVKEIFPL